MKLVRLNVNVITHIGKDHFHVEMLNQSLNHTKIDVLYAGMDMGVQVDVGYVETTHMSENNLIAVVVTKRQWPLRRVNGTISQKPFILNGVVEF